MTTSRGLFGIKGVLLYSMCLVIKNVFLLPNLFPKMPLQFPSMFIFIHATTIGVAIIYGIILLLAGIGLTFRKEIGLLGLESEDE